jgi:hypothetical protein
VLAGGTSGVWIQATLNVSKGVEVRSVPIVCMSIGANEVGTVGSLTDSTILVRLDFSVEMHALGFNACVSLTPFIISFVPTTVMAFFWIIKVNSTLDSEIISTAFAKCCRPNGFQRKIIESLPKMQGQKTQGMDTSHVSNAVEC